MNQELLTRLTRCFILASEAEARKDFRGAAGGYAGLAQICNQLSSEAITAAGMCNSQHADSLKLTSGAAKETT